MTSDLKYEDNRGRGRFVLLPGRRIGFVSDVDKPRETVIRIDSRGRVLESKADAPLPYLLGDLSELVVEPLPRGNEASWTINSDPAVAVVSVNYPYWRSSQVRFREGIPAVEKTVYTIEGESDNLLVVGKHYEMTSAATVAGKPRIEAAGEGKLKFDTRRGVFAALDFDMRVTVREANRSEETPLHITYRLLSDEDLAEAAQDAKKAKDEAENAEREKVRPLNAKEVRAAVADLDSGDAQRMGRAFKLLGQKKPEEPAPRLARTLEAIMLHSDNVGHRADAASALKNWSDAKSVPALMKALGDSWAPVQANALEALCPYKPKEAIKPAARMLVDGMTRGAAAKFLKAMGPDAEDAVLGQIKNRDDWVRATVCELLGVIGTKKSIPALEKAVFDESWMVNGNARKSVAAIKAREEAATEK
jgi:hypothetical protein